MVPGRALLPRQRMLQELFHRSHYLGWKRVRQGENAGVVGAREVNKASVCLSCALLERESVCMCVWMCASVLVGVSRECRSSMCVRVEKEAHLLALQTLSGF